MTARLARIAALAGCTVLALGAAPRREPTWVGVAVCARCHDQAHGRGQVERWRASRHARAYAALALPSSPGIARLSGVNVEPFRSPICLGCHATATDVEGWERDSTFAIENGVQCELCHGPGSEYSDEAVMKDREAAERAGLRTPKRERCLICHLEKGSHTAVLGAQHFEVERALATIAHPNGGAGRVAADVQAGASSPSATAAAPTVVASHPSTGAGTSRHLTPTNLAFANDVQRLYVTCEGANALLVVDTAARKVVGRVEIGTLPHGVCIAPDQQRIYVSNRGSDSVSVVDSRALTVRATLATGDEPHGVALDPAGRTLYVANAGSHDVSVIDLASGREVKRLSAGRGAWSIAPSSDGRALYVSSALSHFVGFREPARSEVTVIDSGSAQVRHRFMVAGANLLQGVAGVPGDDFVLVALLRTKNLVPMTRIAQGWVITSGLGVLWSDGRVDQLLLDEPDDCFADPTGVVTTPDGALAFVTGGGVDEVAAVDLAALRALLGRSSDKERRDVLPNNLGSAAEIVRTRITVGRNPRGLTLDRTGRTLYVADALDDTISVIDVPMLRRVATIDLGGPRELTLERKGERVFHSAFRTYNRQFSCASCHPDGGADGLTYDIEPDGLGVNPVDNRSLRGILDTAPFKWTGKNPTLARQCGPRLAVFFTRAEPFTADEVAAVERYICTIPLNPNRFREGDTLTPAQRRGKKLFERTTTNGGREITEADRCTTCHPPPYYTNRQLAAVATGSPLDTAEVFDVPHLTNVYEAAPYLHDGRAPTLEEIWTRFNPHDRHGVTNDMTKDQLNDLVEFLKTL